MLKKMLYRAVIAGFVQYLTGSNKFDVTYWKWERIINPEAVKEKKHIGKFESVAPIYHKPKKLKNASAFCVCVTHKRLKNNIEYYMVAAENIMNAQYVGLEVGKLDYAEHERKGVIVKGVEFIGKLL